MEPSLNGSEAWMQPLLGEVVVFDMGPPYVYVGTLRGIEQGYLVLEDADAHDLRDSNSTRERYILETRMHGVRTNRARVLVDARQVVAVSKLSDVLV